VDSGTLFSTSLSLANLSLFNLGLAPAIRRFRTVSVGIGEGFSCYLPHVISHGRSTGDENRGFNRDHQRFNCRRQNYVRSDGGVDNNNNDADS